MAAFRSSLTPQYRLGVARTSQSAGCGCVGVCSPDDPTCACAIRQRPHNDRVGNDGAFAYDAQGLLAGEESPPIFECNAACACGPEVRRLTRSC